MPTRRPGLAAALVAAFLAAAPAAQGGLPASLPAAGDMLVERLAVRAGPSPAARVVATLRATRPDGRLTIVHAFESATDGAGQAWLRIRLPLRPNNRTGWVSAEDVALEPVAERIVVDLSARSLRLLRQGRVLVSTRRVGIGRPATPTPRGRFYVTAGYRVPGRAFGVYALETSAFSPTLSDWPGGGIVGIHGTFETGILPGAVSHGCVRVTNRVILQLRRLAPVGTPIDVVP